MDERAPGHSDENLDDSQPAPEGDLANEGGPTQAGDERSEAANGG